MVFREVGRKDDEVSVEDRLERLERLLLAVIGVMAGADVAEDIEWELNASPIQDLARGVVVSRLG